MRGMAFGTRTQGRARAANAVYALFCALGVTAITFGLHESVGKALLFGAAAFILCFALLSLLMAYVKKRQKQQSDELDDE